MIETSWSCPLSGGSSGQGEGLWQRPGFPGPRPHRRELTSSESWGPEYTGQFVQEGRQKWGAPLGSVDRLGLLLTLWGCLPQGGCAGNPDAASPGATEASLPRPSAPAVSLSPSQRLTAGHPGGPQGLGGTQQNQSGQRQQMDESLDNTLPWGEGTSGTSGQNEGRGLKAGENRMPGDRPGSQWGWSGAGSEHGRPGPRVSGWSVTSQVTSDLPPGGDQRPVTSPWGPGRQR